MPTKDVETMQRQMELLEHRMAECEKRIMQSNATVTSQFTKGSVKFEQWLKLMRNPRFQGISVGETGDNGRS